MPDNFAEWCVIEEALNGELPKSAMNKTSPYGKTRMISYGVVRRNKNTDMEEVHTVNKDTFNDIQKRYNEEIEEYKKDIKEDKSTVVIEENSKPDIINDTKAVTLKEGNEEVVWLTIRIESNKDDEVAYNIKRKVKVNDLKNYLSEKLVDSIIL